MLGNNCFFLSAEISFFFLVTGKPGEVSVNLNRIRLFSIVASHANLTKASQILHVSQSSISHQLALLQKDYGVKLYKKTGHGIELTTEGQQFLAETAPLLEALEKFDKEFRRYPAQQKSDSLAIAGTHALSADLLPSLSADFQKMHPQIQLSLRTGNQRAIEKFVLEDDVEIAVTTNSATRSPSLTTEPYGEERIAAFVPVHHPLAKKRKVNLSELLREPLIIRGASGVETTRKKMLRQMEERGYRPKVAAFYDSADAVKVAVRKNTGVGLLYKETIKHDVEKGDFKILNVDDLKLDVHTFVVFHKNRPLSDNAQLFLNFIRARKRNHGLGAQLLIQSRPTFAPNDGDDKISSREGPQKGSK
jgi:LysR family transcriptional activator of glutamate synthase operon